MELTVLGSGTAVPDPARGSAGYLVRRGGFRLLIDCGLGTLRKLAMLGVSPEAIDAVAVSHLHLDHVAEIGPLLFALKNTIYTRSRPLPFYGGPGLRAHLDGLALLYGNTVVPETFAVTCEEIAGGVVSLGPFFLGAIPVRHCASSVAFRIEESGTGKVIAYSGDTAYCDGLLTAIRDADAAVVECSFPDGMGHEGHLTAGEAGRAAEEAGVKKLILSHFYPASAVSDVVAQCRKHFGGEVLRAEDLLGVTL